MISIILSIFLLLTNVSTKELRKDFDKFFRIIVKYEKNERFIIAEPVLPPKDHLLHELFLHNRFYFEYLIKNAVDYRNIQDFADDTTILKSEFLMRIDTSKAFTNSFFQTVNFYLKQHGITLSDFKSEPEEIMFEQLMMMAVRFFEPYRIDDNGIIISNVITNVNTMNDYELIRNYIIEAFCFQALMNETYTKKHNLNVVFARLIQELNQFPFSIEEDLKIKRLQGALWYSLSKDKTLRKVLSDEYQRTNKWLPISIVNF